jgi:hypothetical protein
MRRHGAIWTVALLAVTAALAPAAVQGQDATGVPSDLVSRLPESVDGTPVELVVTMDAGTWIGETYPDQNGREFAALDAALAGLDRSRADVQMAVAAAGPDGDGTITGFQLPDVDVAALRDAILGVYLFGFGDLTRTDEQVAGRTVTMLSQGPLESDDYPFGVLVDRDVVWIVSADLSLLRPIMEALVSTATGTVPRNGPRPTPDVGYLAPESWTGTMTETVTWDKASYAGKTVSKFTGAWVQPLTTINHCSVDECTFYIPEGTIDWSYDVSAPSPPCSASTRGSLKPGKVVVPEDQMLFLEPIQDDSARFWGDGNFIIPKQPCTGWEGDGRPGRFFGIAQPGDLDPFADELNDQYPSCDDRQWRITRDATRLVGRCWNTHEPGYEDIVEWDLTATD